jgi:hypothetical protein
MLITLIPGLLIGAVIGGGANGIRIWTYENNPHEAVAYLLGGNRNNQVRNFPDDILLWGLGIWITISVIFYLHQIMLLLRVIFRTWSGHTIFRFWNILEPWRATMPGIMAIGNLTVWLAMAGTTAGGVCGGIVAIYAALSCFLPVLSSAFCANIVVRIYKCGFAWLSWFMPLCWPGHAVGFLIFLISFWGGRVRFDWRTCNIRVIGGWCGNLTKRGITFGCFSFHKAHRLTNSTLLHESGHVLNHAAFGFMHLLFQYLGIWTRNGMWERMAESHVPLGNRRLDSYDQDDDWPRLRMWGPGTTTY